MVPVTETPQLHLRDDATLRGKPRRADHPWGMPDRVWWLVQRYVGQGVPEPEAIRLAYLYREREAMQRVLEAPSTAWGALPRRPYERSEDAGGEEWAPTRLGRVVIRRDCSAETRAAVRAGRLRGVEWIDGVGGVAKK